MKKTLLFILFIFIFSPAIKSFCEEFSPQQKKLMDIQTELAMEKQKLKRTKAEEQRALSNLYIIRNNLMRAKKNLESARIQVGSNEKKMVVLKRQYDDARSKIEGRSEELKKRLAEVYKSGGGSVLEILFASSSMSDFINRSYYFGRIIRNDAELIDSFRQQVETIKNTKSQLESNNREIKSLVKNIESEKKQIVLSEFEKKKLYAQLKTRRQEYERRVAVLEANSREFEKFIRARGTSHVVSSTGKFGWPLSGRITSRFGFRSHPLWGGRSNHTGLDVGAPYGKAIISSDKGECIYSGWWGGYGKAVVIDHGRGYTTVYGHMSRIYVQTGQSINKGQVIGLVGSTGFSTGPHLHFEIRVNGRPVDPLQYL